MSDNGEGISSDRIAEIKSGGTISTKGTAGETGYGFGLELVKHLIQKVKGSFDVESLQEKGANFTLLIPIVSFI